MKHKKLPACYDGQRRTVRLGKLIKSGGAGSVYFLADDPSRVAKLYHPQTDTAYYQRKLSAMLAQRPEIPPPRKVSRLSSWHGPTICSTTSASA
ncbi:hypothetical protein LNP26_11545 [Klebsiella variicola subsp. variicola]|nr:hypothetical protein [Klebsiella variicola subsp. variicola]